MIGKFARLLGWFFFSLMLLSLGGCAIYHWFSPVDTVPPAPLVKFTPTQQIRRIWSVDVGKNLDAPMTPVVMPDGSVYAASDKGILMRVNKNGQVQWTIHTHHLLSAGVGADAQMEVVGGYDGTVLAYDPQGKLLWHAQASTQIVGPPAIGRGKVIVKCLNGHVEAFSQSNGQPVWDVEQQLPPLIIKSHAGPLIVGKRVFVGYPGGKLIGFNIENGDKLLDLSIAEPKGSTDIERAVDVTASPVMIQNNICAVAYQGRLACFERDGGNLVWERSVSSSAGIAVEGHVLFVSGQNGSVYAYDSATGASLWRQPALRNRSLSSPLAWGSFVVVGDYQGYVHLLSKVDGSFVARISTDDTPIVVRPQPTSRGFIVQTTGGRLIELTLK
ncbi:MAG: outer membrane protein assembly factor BamB [Proteobacteria bacterium]|nr:outer membrane protein assembly factor BamB [Pseudomonadota bacterium]MDE3208848.1 outer membrane protein assembly factor BamB [Pseudomonadota bacterium]